MLPYFEQPTVTLGPLKYHMFGLMMTLGIVSSAAFAWWRARKLGISDDIIRVLFWISTTVLLFCVVLPNAVFHSDRISDAGPINLLSPNHGINSASVFIVCGLTVWIYFKFRGVPFGRHCDVLIQGLVIGWAFGRLGCTFAHDHIGVPSDFFLSFDYPGGSRHNMGFYEFLFTLTVLVPITIRWRNERHPPFEYSVLIGFIYGLFRLSADFLRAYDPRYFGLTSAQWLSITFILTGTVYFVLSSKKSRRRLIVD